MKPLLRLLLVLPFLAACGTGRTPVPVEARARDHGKVGAGEGPAWKDGALYFTDGTHINRYEAAREATSVFKAQCGSSNGLMFDGQGRLVACESKGRRVVRYEPNGQVTVLASHFAGRQFNSPNDLTVDSQGRIYFTDPRYGPRDGMAIKDAAGRPVEGVYRIDPPVAGDGAARLPVVCRVLEQPAVDRPNGILVSPDNRHLYICDNNNNTAGGSRRLMRFDLKPDGTVDGKSRRVIFDWKDGRGPDGMKMDRAGRLYVMAGVNQANRWETDEFKAGCYVLTPRGKLVAFVPTAPDEATNCAFGGDDLRTLYITSGNHLWSIPLNATGWRAGTK